MRTYETEVGERERRRERPTIRLCPPGADYGETGREHLNLSRRSSKGGSSTVSSQMPIHRRQIECQHIADGIFHTRSHRSWRNRLSRSFKGIRLRVATKCAPKCNGSCFRHLRVHLTAPLTAALARIHFTDPLNLSFARCRSQSLAVHDVLALRSVHDVLALNT